MRRKWLTRSNAALGRTMPRLRATTIALVVLLASHGGTAFATAVDAAHDLAREQRVASVGYRLARAAAPGCNGVAPITGMGLHDLASYARSDRVTIRDAYHLETGFGVRFVVPGGAAERAGLRAGDEVVALDGRSLAGFGADLIGRDASPARTDKFVATLGESLARKPLALQLRRSGVLMTVNLAADRGCGGDVVVAQEDALNAWSDGHKVAITARLVDFCLDDDEIAFVLGHEMSHNILRHADRTRGRSSLLTSIGIGAGVIKATEIEADRNAVRLMRTAGFDPSHADTFLRRFGRARVLDPAFTHPGTQRRIHLMHDALDVSSRD